MPELTDLSYVRALCEKYDFALSKGFGQNFIVNPAAQLLQYWKAHFDLMSGWRPHYLAMQSPLFVASCKQKIYYVPCNCLCKVMYYVAKNHPKPIGIFPNFQNDLLQYLAL